PISVLLSFPARRSSDLVRRGGLLRDVRPRVAPVSPVDRPGTADLPDRDRAAGTGPGAGAGPAAERVSPQPDDVGGRGRSHPDLRDRKSTRLNSSHGSIS